MPGNTLREIVPGHPLLVLLRPQRLERHAPLRELVFAENQRQPGSAPVCPAQQLLQAAAAGRERQADTRQPVA